MNKMRSHCNRCLGERNHDILYENTVPWSESFDDDADGPPDIDGSDTYRVLRCSGCDRIAFRHDYWFSEETNGRGQPIEHVTYHPPAISRQKPKWYTDPRTMLLLNDDVRAVFDEIYVALSNNLKMLATMGTRALIDIILTENVGDIGPFAKKIDQFVSRGFISTNQAILLKGVVEAGHASSHRGYIPSDENLNDIMDALENILNIVYIQPAASEKLLKNVPPRAKQI